jgi:hypothetical protein
MRRAIPIRLQVAAWLLLSAAGCPRPTGDTARAPDVDDVPVAGAADATEEPEAAVAPHPCSALVALEEPLEEASLLAVRAGDRIADLDAAGWGESWVQEGEITHAVIAGRHVLAVPLIWAGNAAAVALLRESPDGLCVINAWAFGFGGNGIDITALAVEAAEAEARVRIGLVGHYRGWFQTPGDESSYVEPQDAPMEVVLGTDGVRAWLIKDAAQAP